jgi:hypothetical protein
MKDVLGTFASHYQKDLFWQKSTNLNQLFPSNLGQIDEWLGNEDCYFFVESYLHNIRGMCGGKLLPQKINSCQEMERHILHHIGRVFIELWPLASCLTMSKFEMKFIWLRKFVFETSRRNFKACSDEIFNKDSPWSFFLACTTKAILQAMTLNLHCKKLRLGWRLSKSQSALCHFCSIFLSKSGFNLPLAATKKREHQEALCNWKILFNLYNAPRELKSFV